MHQADGTLLQTVSEANIDALQELGWTPPAEFKASDSETDLWAVASFQKLGCRPQLLYLCCGRPASQILLESGAFPLGRQGPDCWCQGCFENGQDGLFYGAPPVL